MILVFLLFVSEFHLQYFIWNVWEKAKPCILWLPCTSVSSPSAWDARELSRCFVPFITLGVLSKQRVRVVGVKEARTPD